MGYYLTNKVIQQPAESTDALQSHLGTNTPIGSPFGNPILSTKYWDEDSKLFYYGYRYYGPGMGRWLSKDPVGEVGGENTYLAFYNNPIEQIDQDGLCPIFVSNGHEVNSIRDIEITSENGFGGKFVDGLLWTEPCDIKFDLSLTVRSGSAIISGQKYFYVPHIRGNDGLATGNGPFDASRAHEMGHAHAYWIDIRPCAIRLHNLVKSRNRPLTAEEKQIIEDAYDDCKTDAYWLDSGSYANEWERNYYDVTERGKFNRLFRSSPSQLTQPITFGMNSFEVTDLWEAK